MESFQLKSRLSFSVSDEEIGTSLASVDNHSVIYLNANPSYRGRGAICLNVRGTSKLLVDGTEDDADFCAVEVVSRRAIFLEQSKGEQCRDRIVTIDLDDEDHENEVKSFNLDVIGDSQTLEFATTDIDGVVFIALLSKGGLSDPSVTLSILQEDRNICSCSVPGLENASIDSSTTNILWSGQTLSILTPSSIITYRFEEQVLTVQSNLSLADLGVEGELRCQAWIKEMSETLMVSSSCGKLISMKSGSQVHMENQEHEIQSLLGLSKGFLLACSNGILMLYSVSLDGSTFVHERSLILPGTCQKTIVTSMSISSDVNAKTVFIMTSNPKAIYKYELDPIDSVEIMTYFHSEGVTSMDTCLQGPFFVSAGKDRAICIWNIITGNQLQHKTFSEIPLMVSLHPFGKQVLIAFEEEVVCAHILADDLKVFWRMPTASRICKFSDGGHQFAITHDNAILIFDTLSGEKVHGLKGHNSKVQSIFWAKGDSEILSADEDKIIYRWDLHSGSRVATCTQYKSYGYIKFTMISHDNILSIVPDQKDLLSTSSFELQEMENGTKEAVPELQEDSVLLVSNENPTFLVASSSQPKYAIKLFSLDGQVPSEILVKERVSSMSLSTDDKILIVAFVSGSITMYNIYDSRGSNTLLTEGPIVNNQNGSNHSVMGSMLVSEIYFVEKESLKSHLSSAIREVSEEFEYRSGMRKMSNDEEIRRIEEQMDDITTEGEAKIQSLKNKLMEIQSKHATQKQNQFDAFQAEAKRIETTSKAQIWNLSESNRRAEEQWTERINKCKAENEQLISTNKTIMKNAEDALKNRLLEINSEIESSEKELRQKEEESEATTLILEEESDIQIEEAKARYKKNLSLAREKTLKKSSENSILEKRLTSLARSTEDQKETIKILLSHEEDMREQMKRGEEVNKKLREKYDEKIKIKKAKNAVKERVTNQVEELKKFEYVLDEKLSNLNKCLAQNCDEELRKDMQNGLAEHDRLVRENSELRSLLSLASTKVKTLQQRISQKHKICCGLESKRKNLLNFLQQCLDNIQNPDALNSLLQASDMIPNQRLPRHEVPEGREKAEELTECLKDAQKQLKLTQRKNQDELSKLRARNKQLLSLIEEKKGIVRELKLQRTRFQDKNN